MERNKWEEEFKNKLDQREIAPTPHAWDRLDAMLNEEEHKKQKPVRRLGWLYIAAGFIGFILIATMFFKNGNADNNEPVIVEQEKPKVETGNNPMEFVPNDTLQQEQVAVSTSNTKEEKVQPIRQQNIQKAQPKTVQQESQIQVAQVDQTQKPEIKTLKPEDKINQKTNTNGVNVDEQIASLGPKIQGPKPVKVDASSLLSQVDGELELTFREKVIKSVGKKYQNVKVALANRNNKESSSDQ